jgi:polysaccharide pyruvyl transferase WcaK-like protein
VIAEAADCLAGQHGAQVIFVPMRRARWPLDPGQDDDQVCEEIASQMRRRENAHVLQGDYTPSELKAVFGQVDLVLGMRLHSLLLASMMGTPVAGIALMPKFGSFFRLIGQERRLLSPADLSCDTLRDFLAGALSRKAEIREELTARIPAVRELARANQQHLRALLNGR